MVDKVTGRLTSRKAFIIHAVLVVCSLVTVWEDWIPTKLKAPIVGTAITLQMALGQAQHKKNPDGSRAEASWRPEDENK